LACIISIWFDHIHQVVEPEACILSQTDSTSALGWLRKTNFAERPDEGVQLSTARKLASLILETNSNLYSQWFPGDQNYIADSLSRDFHIDDTSLANLLSLHFPEQVPFGLTILADLFAAQSAAKGAVVQGTDAKQVRAWRRFQLYLASIGIPSDPYLDEFSQPQKTKILSAFAHAIREGRLCDGKVSKSVKSESVRSALDCLSQIFKLADRPDPRLDGDGRFAPLLQRQLQGYKSVDPAPRPQVAMTTSILRQFYRTAISPYDKALCELFMGAFFFAMRSCEYMQVSGLRKT